MAEYSNENRGSIWPNSKKETEKHPDFTGTLNVEGVEYWVSAWKRKPTDDPKRPSLTFAIKPKEVKQEPKSAKPTNDFYKQASSPAHEGFDDLEDIPW